METLYTATVTAVGGREGNVKSDDGIIDMKIEKPKSMGGRGGATNPEQLFAAGYSACFGSALEMVLRQERLRPERTAVTAEVSIGPNDKGGFMLAVKLVVEVVGIDRKLAQEAMEKAHYVCPYSNATRGNVEVQLELK
ncbi:organic hydroperoxide resistance protein [Bacteroides sp. 519]|uniref:organic hydroperoxide resistance protein n=1 Tax=Bacteroides sp. 519 TaxID=2302937 RepID=UPI0013D34ACC|nr:organic hydroperoxide resistance protein [Bacteroides sp. 519]NDV57834.1 organic hydroperoxide resistance protein [Bacteroides sp. 519]